MEHMNPIVIDEMFRFGNTDELLVFLVDAMYSPLMGYFADIPFAMSSLSRRADSIEIIRDLDSHIIQNYNPRLSNIISRTFSLNRNPSILFSALEQYPSLVFVS